MFYSSNDYEVVPQLERLGAWGDRGISALNDGGNGAVEFQKNRSGRKYRLPLFMLKKIILT